MGEYPDKIKGFIKKNLKIFSRLRAACDENATRAEKLTPQRYELLN
tara:strand:- start:1820 stop:1957 length:138 start_codon:yes stop_codon:yes gene_type:complete